MRVAVAGVSAWFELPGMWSLVYTVWFTTTAVAGGTERWYVGKCEEERYEDRKEEHRAGKGDGAEWTKDGKWTKKEKWRKKRVKTTEAGREELRTFCSEASAEEEEGRVKGGHAPRRGRGACFAKWLTPLSPVYVGLLWRWPTDASEQDALLDAAAAKWPFPVGQQLRNRKLGGKWPKKTPAEWQGERKRAAQWAEEQHEKREEAKQEAQAAKEEEARAKKRKESKEKKAAKKLAKRKAQEQKVKAKAKKAAVKKAKADQKEKKKTARKAQKAVNKARAAAKKEKAKARAAAEQARDRSGRSQVGRTRTAAQHEANQKGKDKRKKEANKAEKKEREYQAEYNRTRRKETRSWKGGQVKKTAGKGK